MSGRLQMPHRLRLAPIAPSISDFYFRGRSAGLRRRPSAADAIPFLSGAFDESIDIMRARCRPMKSDKILLHYIAVDMPLHDAMRGIITIILMAIAILGKEDFRCTAIRSA